MKMADTVLVTGGAGYIGSHVVAALAASGDTPMILDSFVNSSLDVVTRLRRIAGRTIRCVRADVRNRAALDAVFAEHRVTAVVHCAGLKAVGEGEEEPLRYYDYNVGGAIVLVEAMAAAGVKAMVFSSSATVYGQPDTNPVAENAPLRPASVYGRTKHIIEQILSDVAAADSEWRVALLRYFNPAGAHASALIGEAPTTRANNLVPILARAAVNPSSCIDVYGNDWPTPDGTGVRDYLHVVDLAEGHVAALGHLAMERGVTTLNLGAGSAYSVLEVIAAFERACGHAIAHRIVPRRAGDIASCYADPARANKLLGWRAGRAIDAICADAWRWETSQWNVSTPR